MEHGRYDGRPGGVAHLVPQALSARRVLRRHRGPGLQAVDGGQEDSEGLHPVRPPIRGCGCSHGGLGTAGNRRYLLYSAPFPVILGAIGSYVVVPSHDGAVPSAPTAVRQASLVRRRERLPGGLVAQTGPFLVLATASAYDGLRTGAACRRVSRSTGGTAVCPTDGRRGAPTTSSPPFFFAGCVSFLALTAFSVLGIRGGAGGPSLGTVSSDPRRGAPGDRVLRRRDGNGAPVPALPHASGTVEVMTMAVLLVLSIGLPFALVIVLLVAISRATSAQSKIVAAAPEGDGTPDACWHGGGIVLLQPARSGAVGEKTLRYRLHAQFRKPVVVGVHGGHRRYRGRAYATAAVRTARPKGKGGTHHNQKTYLPPSTYDWF